MKKAKCTSRVLQWTSRLISDVLLLVLKNRGKQTDGSEVRFRDYEWRDRAHA